MNQSVTTTEVSLFILGCGIVCFSIALNVLSGSFAWVDPNLLADNDQQTFFNRPVIAVVVTLFATSIIWLMACWIGSSLDSDSSRSMTKWIVGIGMMARLILLPSTPILEIDLYRYLWDGNVVLATADPYRYAPIEFVQWQFDPENQIAFSRSEEELSWLKSFASQQDESTIKALDIVSQHYGEFTSPYPPVSQSVFALSHWLTPKDSSLATRVFVLKTILVLFDLATGIVLIALLRRLKLPESMSVAWFWSPLVLKEFANSGHLDSIAILFSTLFVLFVVAQLQSEGQTHSAVPGGICLALGVASKIFPIVLVPLWAFVTIYRLRWKAVVPGFVSLSLTTVLMSPLLFSILYFSKNTTEEIPKPGILAFAESWEMNDMIFMVIVENLKAIPAVQQTESTGPWFVFVPEAWRNGNSFDFAFGTSRMVTLASLGLIVSFLCFQWWRTPRRNQDRKFVEYCFLCIAWFWLLSPTQNPWYWCWAIPLLPFSQSRSWYLPGVFVLLYYLRFHFQYHEIDIAGFDFVIPFLEFGPVLVLLLLETLIRWKFDSENTSDNL